MSITVPRLCTVVSPLAFSRISKPLALRIKRSFRTFPSRRAIAGIDMDVIKNAIGENFGGIASKASTHQFSLSQVPDQTGKVAVVTGGSEGIGYGCTHTLLSKNIAKLYILSPSKDVVEGAKEAMSKEIGPEAADKVHWLQCDLSDWGRVKDVAEEIKGSTDRLDILINNAARGIMTYQLTDYGVDRHMAVNHMGHVILTSHLLPLLKKTADEPGNTVRIATMSSNAHESAPTDTKFASLEELNRDLGPMAQYGRAKLANLLYSRYLARKVTTKHPRILANSAHPGFVSTKQSKVDIHEPYPLAGYGMSVLMEPFKKDQFEGALSIMYAATVAEKSGEYICPPAVPEAGSGLSRDDALGDQLMVLTRKLVMEKTKKESADQGCPFDDIVLE